MPRIGVSTERTLVGARVWGRVKPGVRAKA